LTGLKHVICAICDVVYIHTFAFLVLEISFYFKREKRIIWKELHVEEPDAQVTKKLKLSLVQQ